MNLIKLLKGETVYPEILKRSSKDKVINKLCVIKNTNYGN